MRIVVDGDSCPVKKEIVATASLFEIAVLMVSSFDHLLQGGEGVEVVRVDRSSQSADLYIANTLVKGDILITQDYGLAALAIAKSCAVLSPRGDSYHEGNIDYLLDRRHTQAKARRAGQHSKGPKPFTEEHRQAFQQKLTKLLHDLQENV
ncbi:YaiI/YqxD family protein [Paenibacillus sp. CAA11]|uniref:YaiI/YqxD family protein n=1 Tax=Paenibacillus sp. CAA11 TaxID=1532905 RepID=UPI000D394114|nr:YaiI/YqxD family protein [Paenibacillus sp. CAA11]AWB45399.1 YaiI/YqxD family protein [Paenibacillus sp. CAA11]